MSLRSVSGGALTRREALALPLLPALAAKGATSSDWLGRTWRQLHLDAHFGQVANPYADFDADAAAEMLQKAGFAMVSFFASCGAGYSYYPTKIGVPHPGLKRDYTGEMAAALKKRRIRILPYISTGPDRRYHVEHPEWVLARNPQQPAGEMAMMCINSPWVDEVHIPEMKELVAKYDADGFFLDNLLGRITRGPCYCRYCREDFGGEIPVDANDPRAPEVHEWLSRMMARYATKVTSAMAMTKPDLAFVFTHIWVSRNPVKPPECVKQVVWEPAPPYPGVLSFDFSFEGRYLSTQAGIESWSGMATRGNGWGDYSLRDPVAFEHEAAVLLANGGRPYLSDDNYPSGNPDSAVYRVYGAVNERTRRLETIVQGCRPVRDVAVLLSAKSMWAKLPLVPPRDWMTVNASPGVAGAHKALTEAHAQFGILNSETLVANLGDYKALIIPEQCLLTDEEANAIRRFVREGGALILTGDSGTRDAKNKTLGDFSLSDVMGVNKLGQVDARRSFLRVEQEIPGVPRMDVQVSGAYSKVQATSARTLLPLVPAATGKAAPAEAPAAAGLTLNRFGKGVAIYCAAPLFTAYHVEGTPALGNLARWMLGLAYPESRREIALENAPADIEMMLNVRGKARFVHLVNFTGDKRLAGAQRLHEMTTAPGIRVNIRCEARPRDVRLVPENAPIAFEWKDSRLTFTTLPLTLHQVWMVQT